MQPSVISYNVRVPDCVGVALTNLVRCPRGVLVPLVHLHHSPLAPASELSGVGALLFAGSDSSEVVGRLARRGCVDRGPRTLNRCCTRMTVSSRLSARIAVNTYPRAPVAGGFTDLNVSADPDHLPTILRTSSTKSCWPTGSLLRKKNESVAADLLSMGAVSEGARG